MGTSFAVDFEKHNDDDDDYYNNNNNNRLQHMQGNRGTVRQKTLV
jgi:hypothetical protein